MTNRKLILVYTALMVAIGVFLAGCASNEATTTTETTTTRTTNTSGLAHAIH